MIAAFISGVLLPLTLLVAAPGVPISSAVQALVASKPADSLIAPLRRYEQEHGEAIDSGEAAWLLGQLHFARGEYRQACAAFGRAGARLSPDSKPVARYWVGLSWLALKQPEQARAAFDEVAQTDARLRPGALLGTALAWELSERPEEALKAIEAVLARSPGEAGPAALERQIALAERLGRPDLARRAGARLRRDYPRSVEAARASVDPAVVATAPANATVMVQIGAFADPERARSLAESALRGGFTSAQVIVRGDGETRMHVVTLGVFPTRDEATRVGERAAAALGVTYQVTRYP